MKLDKIKKIESAWKKKDDSEKFDIVCELLSLLEGEYANHPDLPTAYAALKNFYKLKL